MRQDHAGHRAPLFKGSEPPSIDRADIVIVGNGIAGLTAAIQARSFEPDARIVIITDQNHPTINTPALKQFAVGKLTREQLLAYPPGTERQERIHLIHARVEKINAQGKFVTLANGSAFGYGSLLLATGSTPTALPAHLPGRDFDGVLTLHRLQDYLDLRRRLPEVEEAVVIGGGAHACETVMCLLHWGIHVHWLIRSAGLLPRMLDETASEMVLERIRQAGASVYTSTEVVGIVGRMGSVIGVVTNHQQFIPCQLVVACTGTKPVTDLAKHCDLPLKHENGILVDDHLRSSVRDIYVAGDVAALKNPLTGRYEPRAQWYAAVEQGRLAGAMMTGHREAARPFGVPWHATHLGDLSMLYVGNPLQSPPGSYVLTDTSRGGYRRLLLQGERLIGYLSLGPMQPDSLAIKRIIDEELPVRDILKGLLKGEFDARQYLSRRRTYSAQDLVTSGRLASVKPSPIQHQYQQTPESIPAVRSSEPAAEAAQPAPRLPTTEQLPPISTGPSLVPQRAPTSQPAASAPRYPILREEEEISPFTGSLPALPEHGQGGTRLNSGSLPASQEQGQGGRRNLWAYSDPALPAFSRRSPAQTQHVRSYRERQEGGR
ncbi:NAD(P)/FAD-dependent oxidoreductase [Thermogemmatispora sp.]|uniref:NAD(P)/FAD-dependent oxidoreductase n=1 Tax=Thermogemmatispora sp. TaxID=1968838 RepID=UPI001DAC9547|nr:FAD/NAD(P)-binding oxidoreductase [Thermogemmatispora sp.]MBX5450366.1 NAD(P)/FAD-dependent oxidoreductase [Thermogemmatispora sp.]